jgi:hypothetical protein
VRSSRPGATRLQNAWASLPGPGAVRLELDEGEGVISRAACGSGPKGGLRPSPHESVPFKVADARTPFVWTLSV